MRAIMREPQRMRELDQEIETLRERLYWLVRSNPSQLRTQAAYELSAQLDELIARLQITMPDTNRRAEAGERSESIG